MQAEKLAEIKAAGTPVMVTAGNEYVLPYADLLTQVDLFGKDNLIFELDNIIAELQKYSDAMKNDDAETLKQLLKDGKEAKLKAD